MSSNVSLMTRIPGVDCGDFALSLVGRPRVGVTYVHSAFVSTLSNTYLTSLSSFINL
jgi:hypothetical protein